MKNTFAGVTEGITDQKIIENILAGYFESRNLDVNWLQPLRDTTDANRSRNFGGWSQVFEYCRSPNFRESFQFNEYVIVHIVTDVSDEYYGVPHQDENGEIPPEQLIEKVIEKFKSAIGEDFYGQCEDKIIFAIAVHSTECWLLPLYYADNKKSKIKSCLSTLNQALQSKEGFTIDPNNKNPHYYQNISSKYCKQKTLLSSYKQNPSLKIFIEEIEKRNIVIEEDI
ncbi:phage tail protein [Tumidithrix elongata RA019]|uniref:Phage tail protein n=1 Tax=Tumidithrix elongata BACA0141 TaxID=2716417 RepID=A0AAW9Q272_9CYAN|nr:phage tail protein [Tumidithrix elongata RA019]